jgi:hypothetical protein
MFNLGLPNDNRNRLTAADVIDPIVLAKYAKPLSHCLVQGIRRHFDSVLASPNIDAGHGASAKGHNICTASIFAFSSLQCAAIR